MDLETGGLNPYHSAICSITLKVLGSNIYKTIYIKKTPNREYNSKALEINRLTFDFLNSNGIDENDAVNEVIDFIKRYGDWKPKILGHNILFDLQFMNVLFYKKCGQLFSNYIHYHPIDTMLLMSTLKDLNIININSVSLNSCYQYFFNHDIIDAHDSYVDVLSTEKIYIKILEILKKIKI
jgi:DNA polymerase III epsilon subunit-like protein